jgi:hypothetical protein
MEHASDLQSIPNPHCINKAQSQQTYSFYTSLILMKRSDWSLPNFPLEKTPTQLELLLQARTSYAEERTETNGEVGAGSIQREIISVKLDVNYIYQPSRRVSESGANGDVSVALYMGSGKAILLRNSNTD